MMHRKLRLGVWLDAMTTPAWAMAMLERLHLSSYAEIHLLVHPAQAGAARRRWGWRTLVYDVFAALDRRLWRIQPDAFAPRPIQALLKEIPLLQVGPEFEAADMEAIRSHDLDILIDLSEGEPRGAARAADAARYGVWGYRHGAHAGMAGFWEVMRQHPVAHTQVYQQQSTCAEQKVVFRASSRTYPWSPARHRHDVFWQSVPLLPRQLEALHRLRPDAYFAGLDEVRQTPVFDDQPDGGAPSNVMAAVWMARYAARLLGRGLQKLWSAEQWFLLYDLQDDISLQLSQYKKLMPPPDRWWADPHVMVRDARYYIFFEELIHRKGRGHIAVLTLDRTGRPQGPPQVALERGYHLSYPYVFEDRDTLYMIPETEQNKTIELYECVEFPGVWQHKMNLMEDVCAVDATVLFYAGKWWLFTSMVEHDAVSGRDELFLFYADDLLTMQWQPHPLNPIVADVRQARPAGRIWQSRDGAKLYRPSQNGEKRYGYGWNLHEIIELTETAYVEKTISRVRPNWDWRLLGTHSFTHAEGLSVIDGLTRRRRFF